MIEVIKKVAAGVMSPHDALRDDTLKTTLGILRERTRRWAKKMGYNEEKKLPPNVQKWVDFFKNHRFDGCREDTIALVSELTGVNLEVLRKSSEDRVLYEVGVLVVPLGNDNGHDYNVGRVIMCFRPRDVFVTSTGQARNALTRTKELVRPATEKEIDDYFLAMLVNAPLSLGTILESVI